MASAWRGLFSCARPGLTRLWWNATTRCGAHSSISCAVGPASPPGSSRSSSLHKKSGRRQLRPCFFLVAASMSAIIGITTSSIRNTHGQSVSSLPDAYSKAVQDAGGVPVLIPCSLSDAGWERLYAFLDGILSQAAGTSRSRITAARSIAPSMTWSRPGINWNLICCRLPSPTASHSWESAEDASS